MRWNWRRRTDRKRSAQAVLELNRTLERLLEMRPGLRVIISSGSSNEIVESGIPRRQGVIYLPKPCETRTMASLLRQCMDRGKSESAP